jgi:hypothetical protein
MDIPYASQCSRLRWCYPGCLNLTRMIKDKQVSKGSRILIISHCFGYLLAKAVQWQPSESHWCIDVFWK